MLGRRGPVQAAFTPPELQGARRARGRRRDRRSRRPRARRGERSGARGRPRARAAQRRPPARVRGAATPEGKPRRIVLRFLASPLAILGDEQASRRSRSSATSSSRRTAASSRARRARSRRIQCGLVLRSVGYRGVPLPGVPFDERAATIPNDSGPRDRRRADVLRPAGSSAARAASSARTRRTPTETVEHLLEDARGRASSCGVGERRRSRSCSTRKAPTYVEYAGWQAIDAPSAPPASRSAGRA